MKYRLVFWHSWGPSVGRTWYAHPWEAETQMLLHGLVGWVQRFKDGKNRVHGQYQVGEFD